MYIVNENQNAIYQDRYDITKPTLKNYNWNKKTQTCVRGKASNKKIKQFYEKQTETKHVKVE